MELEEGKSVLLMHVFYGFKFPFHIRRKKVYFEVLLYFLSSVYLLNLPIVKRKGKKGFLGPAYFEGKSQFLGLCISFCLLLLFMNKQKQRKSITRRAKEEWINK